MNDSFSFDAFLSHNRADKPRVHRLAERLKARGLRVWLDDWVVKPGDDIFLAVEQGLQAARVLVLCMSPDALGSGWVALERSTVLFRDPSNAGRRFIPLLLTDCVLPDTLRRYKHVDYREETNVAFAELLAACLGAEGPRPEDSAVAPGKPKGVRKTPVNRCAYDENPELVFSDDDFRIANKYTADEISESQCDLIIKQLSESLAERGWRLHGMERGPRAWGCTSPAFNLTLLCDSPAIMLNILDERWYAYEHCPKNLRTYVIAQIKEAKSDFKNDAKIRIASDFIENNSNLVDIQETDYLSSAMTDQLRWKCVRSERISTNGQPNEVLWDGVPKFIDWDRMTGTARLKGFEDSLISNQAGGSTFAFSNDGHLMIVAQNANNRESINMLAPSGSGSFDWSDVSRSEAMDLLRLVEFASERELREECALNEVNEYEPIAARVKMFAFARMLHRAGKPEFFCLGRINAPAREIIKRPQERYVRLVLINDQVRPADWMTNRPSDEIRRVCLEQLDKPFSNNLGRGIPLSYPLEHGLKLLAECCKDDRGASAVDRFISKGFQEPARVRFREE